MGGEPTFVSIDDYQSPEWNTEAVGPTKRGIADDLIRRLRDAFAPNGFLHYGQGKWYPGESLPRWTFSLYWRKDGQPIWRDARPDRPRAARCPATDRGSASTMCETIAAQAGDRAGLRASRPMKTRPNGCSRKRSCRSMSTPGDSSSPSPRSAPAIARVFDQGLNVPTGFVLPVQRWNARTRQRCWISQRWPLRRGALFLKPGDSPVGFRLPLASLPYIAAELLSLFVVDQDPTECAPRSALGRRTWRKSTAAAPTRPPAGRSNQQLLGLTADVRTAVAVEPRDGRLHVFMPPVERSRIISNCSRRSRPAPPISICPCISRAIRRRSTARLQVIRVTPDPGVIEVNVHPAANWDDLAVDHRQLYEHGAAVPARHRKIHDRWPPCRHRRRQPCRDRRRDARRFARSCAGPTC